MTSDEGKVFAEVFMCQSCFQIAERLFASGEAELKMMLLVLKESIRVTALTEGLQHCVQFLGEMKKEDLISHLAKMAAEVKRSAVPTTVKSGEPQCQKRQILESTPSPESTSPLALPAGGKPISNSNVE